MLQAAQGNHLITLVPSEQRLKWSNAEPLKYIQMGWIPRHSHCYPSSWSFWTQLWGEVSGSSPTQLSKLQKPRLTRLVSPGPRASQAVLISSFLQLLLYSFGLMGFTGPFFIHPAHLSCPTFRSNFSRKSSSSSGFWPWQYWLGQHG